ncbi:hypothetical protein [Leptospira sp. GIMC2001]|uniref:hypothetical protein n=1 Tax=Leptospira sp. GIMC2001 TaxID=1513297 RepID=UPI00234AEECA|nr:hypothetical protein [Leptospira sp. GIMC2001]WCL50995.1 hypothetical protein O4O04_09340 [Leptospira sp. GIMC2001]
MFYTWFTEKNNLRINSGSGYISPMEAEKLIEEMTCHFITITYLNAIDNILIENKDIFLLNEYLTECSSHPIFTDFVSNIQKRKFNFLPKHSFKELCFILGGFYFERYSNFETGIQDRLNNLYDILSKSI